ncbi:hypothetical protein IMG5_170640 [Ichthyophthirius multifiliis]|uniref:Uncharacterized protein n=1 Tax=Ichthyophthirius multifiliis TaxID=5932 RepID=G0R1H9_ICHMU|nr:hypothetical protein IMG5_170640 [Ichthyophthirius multifiliis]EGR28680.1 hypothetical protein IMG5_170640 [Ichthyophthirius multifiliis]|eukprot:XP_004029916.1 hypothetical protein IMG5_170640 [Ichthyophthirius multifiliis]
MKLYKQARKLLIDQYEYKPQPFLMTMAKPLIQHPELYEEAKIFVAEQLNSYQLLPIPINVPFEERMSFMNIMFDSYVKYSSVLICQQTHRIGGVFLAQDFKNKLKMPQHAPDWAHRMQNLYDYAEEEYYKKEDIDTKKITDNIFIRQEIMAITKEMQESNYDKLLIYHNTKLQIQWDYKMSFYLTNSYLKSGLLKFLGYQKVLDIDLDNYTDKDTNQKYFKENEDLIVRQCQLCVADYHKLNWKELTQLNLRFDVLVDDINVQDLKIENIKQSVKNLKPEDFQDFNVENIKKKKS